MTLPSSQWPIVQPGELKAGDRIRGEFEATVTKVSKGWIDTLIIGAETTCVYDNADLAAMTIRRSPPPVEPVTVSEAMEALRPMIDQCPLGSYRDAAIQALARYDAQRKPDAPAESDPIPASVREAAGPLLAWAKLFSTEAPGGACAVWSGNLRALTYGNLRRFISAFKEPGNAS